MDEFYIKLLLLIGPPLIAVLAYILSPIVKEKTFNNNLIGKNITISIRILNEDQKDLEIYNTVGQIKKIKSEILEVKRNTQPNFKIPYNRMNLSNHQKLKDEYFYFFYVDSEKQINQNFGIYNQIGN